MSGLPVFQSLEDVEFVERLGAGLGAGRFKARLAQHDAPVALLLESPGHTDRGHFVAWAQRLARLDHPCVPQVVHVEQVLEPAFVAFAFHEGRTLDEALSDATSALDKTAALTALAKVAAGLRAAHAAGLVHGALAARCVVLEPRPHAADAVRVTGWAPCPDPIPPEAVAEDARALLALAQPHLPPEAPLPVTADVRGVDDVLEAILPALAELLKDAHARAASDLEAAQSDRTQAAEAREQARALAAALRAARQAALAAETRVAENVERDRRRALERWTHQRIELELLLGRPLTPIEVPALPEAGAPPATVAEATTVTQVARPGRRASSARRPRIAVLSPAFVALAGASAVVVGWALWPSSTTDAPPPALDTVEQVEPQTRVTASEAPTATPTAAPAAPVEAPPGMAYVPAGLVSIGLAPPQVQVVLEQCRAELGETAAARACTPALLASEGEAAPAKIDAFFIDQLEVSQAQWAECVAAKRCEKQRLHWDLPTQPVTGVTRAMASAYCAFRDGRLPTADEWLRAARGGDARAFPWGDSPVRGAEGHRANAGAYIKGKRVGGRDDGHPYPAPVSAFAARGASPFGVSNLSGNVREWTATDATPEGRAAIVLGGGWKSLGHELRLSRREVVKSEDFAADLGLRCVRDEKK